jgi:putative PIN family toxin of toxin-antitoxin system
LRAVLDPNVLSSGVLAPRGAPARLLARWLAGDFELVVSELVLAELERALAYPKLRARVTPADAAELLELLRTTATQVEGVPDPAPRSRDPGDDYLLALAERGNAVLVSGDGHLLELSRSPIRRPAEFLRELPP